MSGPRMDGPATSSSRRGSSPAATSSSPTRRSGSTPGTRSSGFATHPRWSAAARRRRPRSRPSSTPSWWTRSSRCRRRGPAELAKLLENTFRHVNIGLVQRARDARSRDGYRRVGGHRRRVDQALRLHAVLPGARCGWPLHPARSHLPLVAGASRRRTSVQDPRAGRGRERAGAPIRDGPHRRGAERSWARREGERASWCSGSRTSPTSAISGSPRPSR